MRMDYNYDIIYLDTQGEQYTFTSCKWFGSVESALINFEQETGMNRIFVTDVFRLIKGQSKPLPDHTENIALFSTPKYVTKKGHLKKVKY
jgi:hypothetical protein